MNYTNESSSSSGFIFGLLVGAVAGAGLALLFAPKAGSELRGDIGESMTSFKDAASKRMRDMADRAGTGLNDLQSAVGKAAGQAGSAAHDMMDSAVERGRQEIRTRT